MTRLHVEHAWPSPTHDLTVDAPALPPLIDASADVAPGRPLVEPPEMFEARIAEARRSAPAAELLAPPPGLLPMKVSNRAFQRALEVGQGARGSCWAFAGVAALEAAYARRNIRVDLSEHYLFHISKAHENHLSGRVNSLIGFQGAADIVHHMKYWAVPLSAWVPYIDQGPLQTLANGIPNTGGALAKGASGTREQNDWFEYDLRNIPLMGPWNSQYRVATFGFKSNYTNDDIRNAIASGYDVVVDCFDKINNGGHALILFGYDDAAQTFEIKNSQATPGWETLKYTNDPHFNVTYTTTMYYVMTVEPVATQVAAMWVGRWETDHDGWLGRLVIRRFLDIRADIGIPGPNNRISLGTWYGDDGRVLDVFGHFVDGGRGLICNIGDQPFEIYLHGSDPYRASGRCFWNNQAFGVTISRGTAMGAGSGFDRAETIGLWDMVHDGWRGQLRIGAAPTYVQAADSVVRNTWIDPAPIVQQVDAHIDFGSGNNNQHFQLLVHTREDGVYGGVTQWAGRDYPVEGRMSQNLYSIQQDGKLRWYQHTGRPRLKFEWAPEQIVGSGWGTFRAVFGGGDGVIYAIQTDGTLMWYQHEGRNQGTFQWKEGKVVGSGWTKFRQVFAGDGGVIYGLQSDGKLIWYRHLGRRDGSFRWQGPFEVGTGWNVFTAVTAAPDGCLYGILPDGTLLWYRHYGHDQGYPIWYGKIAVGSGWQGMERIWATGNGYLYARTAANNGELWLWRHHGFQTGAANWSAGAQVGAGWGGTTIEVFTT